MSKPLDIGFLVEGDIDKAVVETVGLRLLKKPLGDIDFDMNVVRLGGRAGIPWAWATVHAMLEEHGHDHVIVVLDADTIRQGRAANFRRNVQALLEQYHVSKDDASVCIAIPTIEAWLLAAYDEHPEQVENPKAKLCEILELEKLTAGKATELATALDIDLARKRAPSFDEFIKTVTKIAGHLRATSAAA